MGQILSQLLAIFYTKKLDIVVIGLENRYDIDVCIYTYIVCVCTVYVYSEIWNV